VKTNSVGERKLPADVQVSLYRIAQELLNNAVKHARATLAVITLRMGDTVRMNIVGDGIGFDPSTISSDHFGLKITREHAETIDAKFSIYSELSVGTQVSVMWR
jgi:signal transduction histidine kinase